MKINKKILICTILILLSLFAISKREEISRTLGFAKEEAVLNCENTGQETASISNNCNTNESSSLFMGCSNTF